MDIPVRRHIALALAAVAVVGLLLLFLAGPAIGEHGDAPADVATSARQLEPSAPSVNLTPDDPGAMLTDPAATPVITSSSTTQGTLGAADSPQPVQLAADEPQPDPTTTVPTAPAAPTGEGNPNGPNGELAPTAPPPPPNPAEAVNPTINPTDKASQN